MLLVDGIHVKLHWLRVCEQQADCIKYLANRWANREQSYPYLALYCAAMPHIMLWLGLCCAATCAYDCLSYEDELLEMRFWLINLLCALAARSLSHESLTVSMRLIYVYEGIRWLLLAPFCVCCHLLHLHNALRIGYAISRMKETLLSVRLIYDCLFWFKMMLRFCTDRKERDWRRWGWKAIDISWPENR